MNNMNPSSNYLSSLSAIARQIMTSKRLGVQAQIARASLLYLLGSLGTLTLSPLLQADAQTFLETQSRCQDEPRAPCLPRLLARPIQRSRSVFYLQARVSPNKVPTGRGDIKIFVNLSTSEGRVVCRESFEHPHKIRDGVLNVEIGRGMDCALDEVLAENANLKIQLCLGSSSSCLRAIDLTSVPFSLTANVADEATRSRTTTMSAQSRYTQRLTADRDVLFPDRVGYGYFDFFTHPVAHRGSLYATDEEYESHQNSGFIQWTPVRGYEGPESRFGANRLYIVAESTQGQIQLLKSVNVMARETQALGRFEVREGHVEVSGDSDKTRNLFHHDLLVSKRVETPRLKVSQGAEIIGDVIVTRNLSAQSLTAEKGGDLRGQVNVGSVEVQGGADVSTRVATLKALNVSGSVNVDVPTRLKIRGGVTVGAGVIPAGSIADGPNTVGAPLPAQRGMVIAGASEVEGAVMVEGSTTMTRDIREGSASTTTQGVWMRASPEGTKRRVFTTESDGDIVVNLTPPTPDQEEAPEHAQVRIKANRVIFEQKASFEAGKLGNECVLTQEPGSTVYSFKCGDNELRFASDQCGNGRRFRCSCGDGELNLGEECDDGDNDNTDECLNSCILPRCGDGYARIGLTAGEEGYEECDDKNNNNEDACTNDCLAAACGDNITRTDLPPGVSGHEACDDGNRIDDDECTNHCQDARCGDQITRRDIVDPNQDGYEECDDGNTDNSDACTNTCRAARCGDEIRQLDEECDSPNRAECDADCYRVVCGNSRVQQGEACDDGNTDNNDACTNSCRVAVCGDNIVRRGVEECDDGNRSPYDACDANCQKYCDVLPLIGHLHQSGGTFNVNTRDNPSTLTSTGGGGPQAAIALTLDRRTRVNFESITQDYDAYFHLRAQCDDRAHIAYDDDSGSYGDEHPQIIRWLNPGTYFLIVDGFMASSGSSTVRVELDSCTGIPVDRVIRPDWYWGFRIFGHRLFPTSGAFEMSNEGGAEVLEERCGGRGPQRAVRLELTQSALVSFRTEGNIDSVLHLRDNLACGRGDDIICNNNGGSGLNSQISARLGAGVYYLIVDGYRGAVGSTRIHYDIR